MADAQEKREDIITAVLQCFEDSGETSLATWTGYEAPVETPALPCVMVVPRGPYRTLETMGEGGKESVHVTLQIIVPLSINGVPGLNTLDLAIDALSLVNIAYAYTQLEATDAITEWELASVGVRQAYGIDVLIASLEVTLT